MEPLDPKKEAAAVSLMVKCAEDWASDGVPELLDVVADRAATIAVAHGAWRLLKSSQLNLETRLAVFKREQLHQIAADAAKTYGVADEAMVERGVLSLVEGFVNAVDPHDLARVLGV
jgi:hypothetical protein